MTLEKIRAALPTHIMLTPGVHRYQPGDAYYFAKVPPYWHEYESDSVSIGELVDEEVVRRPIPPHILDNQAFWIWFDLLDANTRPGLKTQILHVALSQPEYKAGRLYDKWLLEQMVDV